MICCENFIKFCCVLERSIQIWSMIGIVEEPSTITMTLITGVSVWILVPKKKGYYCEQLFKSREVLLTHE